MIHQVEEATVWLRETSGHWKDDWNHMEKGFFGIHGDDILDKVNDDKLARDVDDLFSLFVELEEGTTDLPLPCDEDVLKGAEVVENWIGELENDAVNVDDLSAAFDQIVEEQASAVGSKDEGEEMEDSDEKEDVSISIQMVPCAPTWAVMAPLDPRSVIRTQVCKDVDARIPRVQMPRMDLSFSRLAMPVVAKPVVKLKDVVTQKSEYEHDAATCWICKSDKSPFKKFALHRYLEKRHRRNWKRGPRYSGRSNVATSRVRDGGRFIQTTQWI